MDLFELLIIALFFIIPLIEQLLKRGKGDPRLPETELPEEEGRIDPVPDDREPISAADMVPDDLWTVLTGERRPGRGGVSTAEQGTAVDTTDDPAPWSDDAGNVAPWDEGDAWAAGKREAAEAESLEYVGPEAYSLEEVDIAPVSLERPLPSPEARHRAFHELVDRPPPKRTRRRSALARALNDPGSVRQAVVLTEVLGPPKGLT